jgi:hypothetical protein
MSHYIYKRKLHIEVSDGRILPLCYYADSSVTLASNPKAHPYHWAVVTTGHDGLLIAPKLFYFIGLQQYNQEIDKHARLYAESNKNPDGSEMDLESARKLFGPESVTYCGDSFPGGRRLKNLLGFFSVRKMIRVDDFSAKNPDFRITLEPVKRLGFTSYEPKKEFPLRTDSDYFRAEEAYQKMRQEYPDSIICVGVEGLHGERPEL